MKIIYTHTDEAPALATQSLLPILEAFAAAAGVEVELRDISLAGRILAQFPDRLRRRPARRRRARRARRAGQDPRGQHHQAAEHQRLGAAAEGGDRRAPGATGYALPDYPDEPADDEQREVRARYDRVKGSAVNPVLREGNSDRRAPASVKAYARKPSRTRWAPGRRDSRSHVATMTDGDFRSTERSVTVERDGRGADRARRAPTATVDRAQGHDSRCSPARCSTPRSCAARRSTSSSPQQIADAKRAGRAVLGPSEGDDDEGL